MDSTWRVPVLVGFAGLLLASGCATRQLASAKVELSQAMADECIASALEYERGVHSLSRFDVGEYPTYHFTIELDDLMSTRAPRFIALQSESEGVPQLQIEAGFDARKNMAELLRGEVLARQQGLLAKLVATCAGDYAIDFGPEHKCGPGLEDTVCIQGTGQETRNTGGGKGFRCFIL